jgi:ornithine cyclodeaminase
MQLRILDAADVRRALPMPAAIEGMKAAFAQLSTGRSITPLRSHIEVQSSGGVTLIMPAYLPADDALAVKIVSVFPQNAARQEPTIHAAVLALDPVNGRPVALLEGGTLTAIRTGAGSGAATDLLARRSAEVAAIIGSGVQARTQLEAVCCVRDIREVWVYSPNLVHAAAFASEMAGRTPIPATIHVTASAEEAVSRADVICTATTSLRPVFPYHALQTGAHVNAVGSFTPQMHELDEETIRASLVVVDSREAALEEAGELISALQSGVIGPEHIYAELGEIVAGKKPGRQSDDQITLFKSVGVAVQDAAAASIALQNAARDELGVVVSL